MNTLRVALCTDADVFAGTERHILDLAGELKCRGIGITIACPAASPLAERASRVGITVLPLPAQKGVSAGLKTLALLCSHLHGGKSEILHAHNGRTALLCAIAKKLARRGRIVATQHFLAPAHSQRTGIKGALSRMAHHWVNRTADHLIAISHATRDAMLARGDATAEKLSVVHNGIPEPKRGTPVDAKAIRSSLGIKDERPLVVCAARLEPEKDIPTLIRAMEIVRHTLPQIACAIAGDGSQKALLECEIEARGLAGTVSLLGFQADIHSLIHACDLFVLPSLAEPFGLAILEAMALAKPVIATRVGGPLEIILDHTTGLLVPPSDPRALAAAMATLASNRGLASQMGGTGRARFCRKFTAGRMADSILEIYSRI